MNSLIFTSFPETAKNAFRNKQGALLTAL